MPCHIVSLNIIFPLNTIIDCIYQYHTSQLLVSLPSVKVINDYKTVLYIIPCLPSYIIIMTSNHFIQPSSTQLHYQTSISLHQAILIIIFTIPHYKLHYNMNYYTTINFTSTCAIILQVITLQNEGLYYNQFYYNTRYYTTTQSIIL